jgi:hypothetical protein
MKDIGERLASIEGRITEDSLSRALEGVESITAEEYSRIMTVAGLTNENPEELVDGLLDAMGIKFLGP